VLSTSAEITAALIDRLEDGVWVLDARDSTIIEANPAACQQVGMQPGALLHSRQHRFVSMLAPELEHEGWRLMLAQIPPLGTHRVTVSLRHRDGHIVPAELTLMRHNSEVASIHANAFAERAEHRTDVVVAVTRDLDERVRLVEHLRSQRELLDSTIEALGQGVAVIDRAGRILNVNPMFAELLDLPIDRILDRSIFDPPWTALDRNGMPSPPEATPAVICLRTGKSGDPALAAFRGNGSRRPADETVWLRVTSEPLRDGGGHTDGAVVTLTDVTASHLAEQELERLSRTDLLTRLRNRTSITEILVEAVERSSGGSECDEARVGVLQVDLDNFRSINETFGTIVADQVLIALADRLRDLADRHVEIGRVGVDEFLVVVAGEGPSLEFEARLRRLGEEIQRRTERPLTIDGLELRLTASIGVARWPGDSTDGQGLLRAADRALVTGRRDGRRQLRFYEQSFDERTRTGLALDRDLRLAAAQRGLEVHYQPIIDLRTGDVAAAEALVRWYHPVHGPIPPSVFIPTAEATGAISAISDLVVTTVAEDLAGWNAQHLLPAGARIAVNISAAEFAQHGFIERLSSTLANAGVSPSQLELEITETLLMRDLETTAQRLTALDELGFLVALDDFGTGYSSLSYLHSLPLHTLKVDRCFVGDLRDGRSETITRSILSLAHGLGIIAVGEGVETEEQRAFLIDAGCDLVQGFFFAPPLPRPAFEQFLLDHSQPGSAGARARATNPGLSGAIDLHRV
jgi:diguanylate cyclase (GGDEF)-like protein/PAS domain S-box-containing protein